MKDARMYDFLVTQFRKFFREEKGYIEIPTQSRLSILAACEDPSTISQFVFNGTNWPLPQTGQMWLEYELLTQPDLQGVFCISTSYRNEPFPIAGRHDKIFPMLEFEGFGGIDELKRTEEEFLEYLGFDAPTQLFYKDACEKYGVDILEAEHETKIWQDLGSSVSLELFPKRTDPFWNMKRCPEGKDEYHKVDVILFGMETIGSASRSTEVEEMREDFLSISDGEYAGILFNAFGKERVLEELKVYLEHAMVPRHGGGIGATRLARAWEMQHQ
jgi:hypothetical protein